MHTERSLCQRVTWAAFVPSIRPSHPSSVGQSVFSHAIRNCPDHHHHHRHRRRRPSVQALTITSRIRDHRHLSPYLGSSVERDKMAIWCDCQLKACNIFFYTLMRTALSSWCMRRHAHPKWGFFCYFSHRLKGKTMRWCVLLKCGTTNEKMTQPKSIRKIATSASRRQYISISQIIKHSAYSNLLKIRCQLLKYANCSHK